MGLCGFLCRVAFCGFRNPFTWLTFVLITTLSVLIIKTASDPLLSPKDHAKGFGPSEVISWHIPLVAAGTVFLGYSYTHKWLGLNAIVAFACQLIGTFLWLCGYACLHRSEEKSKGSSWLGSDDSFWGQTQAVAELFVAFVLAVPLLFLGCRQFLRHLLLCECFSSWDEPADSYSYRAAAAAEVARLKERMRAMQFGTSGYKGAVLDAAEDSAADRAGESEYYGGDSIVGGFWSGLISCFCGSRSASWGIKWYRKLSELTLLLSLFPLLHGTHQGSVGKAYAESAFNVSIPCDMSGVKLSSDDEAAAALSLSASMPRTLKASSDTAPLDELSGDFDKIGSDVTGGINQAEAQIAGGWTYGLAATCGLVRRSYYGLAAFTGSSSAQLSTGFSDEGPLAKQWAAFQAQADDQLDTFDKKFNKFFDTHFDDASSAALKASSQVSDTLSSANSKVEATGLADGFGDSGASSGSGSDDDAAAGQQGWPWGNMEETLAAKEPKAEKKSEKKSEKAEKKSEETTSANLRASTEVSSTSLAKAKMAKLLGIDLSALAPETLNLSQMDLSKLSAMTTTLASKVKHVGEGMKIGTLVMTSGNFINFLAIFLILLEWFLGKTASGLSKARETYGSTYSEPLLN